MSDTPDSGEENVINLGITTQEGWRDFLERRGNKEQTESSGPLRIIKGTVDAVRKQYESSAHRNRKIFSQEKELPKKIEDSVDKNKKELCAVINMEEARNRIDVPEKVDSESDDFGKKILSFVEGQAAIKKRKQDSINAAIRKKKCSSCGGCKKTPPKESEDEKKNGELIIFEEAKARIDIPERDDLEDGDLKGELFYFAKEKSIIEKRRAEEQRDQTFAQFRNRIHSIGKQKRGFLSRRLALIWGPAIRVGYFAEKYDEECFTDRMQELLTEVMPGDSLLITAGPKNLKIWDQVLDNDLEFLLDQGIKIYFCSSPVVEDSRNEGVECGDRIAKLAQYENFHFFVTKWKISDSSAIVLPPAESVTSGNRQLEAVIAIASEEDEDLVSLANSRTSKGVNYISDLLSEMENPFKIDEKVDHLMILSELTIENFLKSTPWNHALSKKHLVRFFIKHKAQKIVNFQPYDYPRVSIQCVGNSKIWERKVLELKEVLRACKKIT